MEAVESNGSSSDRDTIEERVIRTSEAGSELEYDLPQSASAQDRAGQWQFPARVFKTEGGSLHLLNREELSARNKAWLKAAGLTDSVCGHWVFTWNAFKIECEPEAVIDTIKSFGMGPDKLAAGSRYEDSQALGPISLQAKDGGRVFWGEAQINAEAIRQSRAQADVVTAEIMRKPITLEAALRAHDLDRVLGKIAVTVTVDSEGRPTKQVKVTTLNIQGANGPERRTVTQTLERRPVQ